MAGETAGAIAGDSGDAGAAGAATSSPTAPTPSSKTAPSISVETPTPPTRGLSRGGNAANAGENDPAGVEASPRTLSPSDPEKRKRLEGGGSANDQNHQGKGEGKGGGTRLSEDGKGLQVDEEGGGERSGDAEDRRREGERREKEVSLLRNLVDKLQREVEGLKSDHEVKTGWAQNKKGGLGYTS